MNAARGDVFFITRHDTASYLGGLGGVLPHEALDLELFDGLVIRLVHCTSPDMPFILPFSFMSLSHLKQVHLCCDDRLSCCVNALLQKEKTRRN